MNSALLRKMEQEKAEGEGDLRTTSLAMAESLNDLGVVLSSITEDDTQKFVAQALTLESNFAIYPSSAHIPPNPRCCSTRRILRLGSACSAVYPRRRGLMCT